eukprot:6202496-Pleurochrysis_carterae.AAC.5
MLSTSYADHAKFVTAASDKLRLRQAFCHSDQGDSTCQACWSSCFLVASDAGAESTLTLRATVVVLGLFRGMRAGAGERAPSSDCSWLKPKAVEQAVLVVYFLCCHSLQGIDFRAWVELGLPHAHASK